MSEAPAGAVRPVGAVRAVARRQRTPRSSAQRRLLDAVTRAAGSEGYSDLTVERVLEVAGVARASFYQYFASLDDCFAAAYREQAERLTCELARAVRGGESAEFALLAALAGTARRDPDAARLLAIEGLAAGAVGRRVRDELVAGVERAMTVSGTQDLLADLPPPVLIGTALRFAAMRLTDDALTDAALDAGRAWVETFRKRDARPGWSARLAPAARAGAPASPQARAPGLPRGTARERLLHATAVAVRERGYRSVTVADIAAVAKVSRRSFYNEFAGKPDIVVAACEHAFARVAETCARAFFGAPTWPERIWQSGLAFTGFFTSEPWFAHLGFVDCYAVGRAFVPRAHEMQLAFTLFLEEGYRQRDAERELPRLCSEMTTAAVMEIGFQASRGPAAQSLRRLQPLAAYIVLTPFVGSDAAAEFVLGNL
jgi:AcrR family transcriptional regulator